MKFRRVPASPNDNPPKPIRIGDVDKYHRVAGLIQSGLKKQRRIPDKRFRLVDCAFLQNLTAGTHPRVKQLLKPSPLLRIVEHFSSNRRPINAAIHRKNFPAPPLPKRSTNSRVQIRLPHQRIRLNHQTTQLTKQSRHKRLAAANPTRDSNDRLFHIAFVSGQWSVVRRQLSVVSEPPLVFNN